MENLIGVNYLKVRRELHRTKYKLLNLYKEDYF